MTEKKEQNTEPALSLTANRREFLGKIGKTAIAAAAIGAVTPLVDKKSVAFGQTKREAARGAQTFYQNRMNACYQLRADTAATHIAPIPPFYDRANNGDETLYPNRIGNYSKGMPHQSNGEVVATAYNAFLNALASGSPAMFEQIPLGGDRKFTNPQS